MLGATFPGDRRMGDLANRNLGEKEKETITGQKQR